MVQFDAEMMKRFEEAFPELEDIEKRIAKTMAVPGELMPDPKFSPTARELLLRTQDHG
jgi:hypothetical protein